MESNDLCSDFFVSFGAPGEAWSILQYERRLPCELLVQHVAEEAVFRGDPEAEALGGEGASRNESEPDSAS